MNNNKKKRNVLLIAFINSHLTELIRLALFLKKNYFIPSILYVYIDQPIKDEYLEICNKNQIKIIDEYGATLDKSWQNHNNKIKTDIRLLPSVLKKLIIRVLKSNSLTSSFALRVFNLFRPASHLKKLLIRIKHAKSIIKENKADFLIMTEENVGYQTGIYTNIAKVNKIPILIVPYTIANAVENAEHVHDDSRYQVKGALKKIIAKIFPTWVYDFKRKKLFALTPVNLIISELLNIAPPNPWMINSGSADAIAVESRFMEKYYLKNGISKSRLVFTGSISDDVLYENLKRFIHKRKQLYQLLNIHNDKPMLLCAIPPPWFPRPECEFSDFRQMIDFWVNTLISANNYNIVISLHPSLDIGKMKYIEKSGVKISKWTAAELIPLADIYVANISATIRWAIACGKPVLNYDVYKYHFHDYDSAKGVITVENKEDFNYYYQKLTEDNKFLMDYSNRQKQCMRKWGQIDGKSGKRIISLLDTINN